MKKSIAIILTMFMLLSVFAIAETNDAEPITSGSDDTDVVSTDAGTNPTISATSETEDATTEEVEIEADEQEIEIIGTPLGAEIRLLQLQKAILKHLYFAEEIVGYVEDEEASAEANAILDEMTTLLESVKSYSLDDKSKDTLVEDFLTFKEQAKDLTKQFREVTKDFITGEEASKIRESLKDLDKSELESVGEEIRSKIRELNALRLEQTLNAMGIENEELVDKVLGGETDRNEVKDFLKTSFKELNPEKKKEVAVRARQQIVNETAYYQDVKNRILKKSEKRFLEKRVVASKQIRDIKQKIQDGRVKINEIRNRLKEKKDDIKEAAKERLQVHKEDIQQRREILKKGIRNRLQNANDNAQERVQDIKGNIQKRRENAKENTQQRIANARVNAQNRDPANAVPAATDTNPAADADTASE